MYITVRLNRQAVGKTSKSLHCTFDSVLEPLPNVSVNDVLLVRSFPLRSSALVQRPCHGHSPHFKAFQRKLLVSLPFARALVAQGWSAGVPTLLALGYCGHMLSCAGKIVTLRDIDGVRRQDVAVQFKLKGITFHKYLIGQATIVVKNLVRSSDSAQCDVEHTLPLHGANTNLRIRWTWEPFRLFSTRAFGST
jgi:hypothetical protein